MSAKKLKPRRMWANYYRSNIVLHPSRESAIKGSEQAAHPEAVPVAVIPLDDVEALIHAAAAEYIESSARWISVAGRMTDALVAIGVISKAWKK